MDSDPWDVEIPSSSPEFDGHNYWRWSRGVRCALMRAGVWKCVVSGGPSGKPPFKATSADLYTPTEEEYEEWLLRDDTALAVIRRSLGRGCQHLAYEESSAAVLWQRIKRNYGTHSLADMFGLWEKIAKYRFSEDSNKTVEDQAYELLDLCDELADGGVEISEIQRVFAILSRRQTSSRVSRAWRVFSGGDAARNVAKTITPLRITARNEDERVGMGMVGISRV